MNWSIEYGREIQFVDPTDMVESTITSIQTQLAYLAFIGL